MTLIFNNRSVILFIAQRRGLNGAFSLALLRDNKGYRRGEMAEMYISIDFNSDEALYLQLRNQIIMAIVKAELQEGENLPSVREMAETVGINMHTVNKAYSVLRQDGYLTLDRRRGAVVAVDMDQVKATMELAETLDLVLAQAICKKVAREDVHELVDRIYNQYEQYRK